MTPLYPPLVSSMHGVLLENIYCFSCMAGVCNQYDGPKLIIDYSTIYIYIYMYAWMYIFLVSMEVGRKLSFKSKDCKIVKNYHQISMQSLYFYKF